LDTEFDFDFRFCLFGLRHGDSVIVLARVSQKI
jgi:hypothetical protein